MNEREHGLMWQAQCLVIEVMLTNVYGSPLKWSEVGSLYRALLGPSPTVGEQRGS